MSPPPLLLPTATSSSMSSSSSSSPSDSASASAGESGVRPNHSPAEDSSTLPGEFNRRIHRVSLACLPCRSRHVKCNAAQPKCSRCSVDGVPCTYAQSRRRGHRRARLATDVASAGPRPPQVADQPRPSPDSSAATSAYNDSAVPEFSFASNVQSTLDSSSLGINEDLIALYYTYFHPDHPCALPRWALSQHCVADPDSVLPVLLVMQYIGSLFDASAPSESLKSLARNALPLLSQADGSVTPYQVQAMHLYGIAVYWSDETEQGLDVLRRVVQLALGLKMHQEPFAAENGRGDPVLEESWRRTWWVIYITDGSLAASTHSFPTQVWNIELTVALPCEEECYESGKIPTPRTLKEFDVREFLPDGDPGFSSFAQLAGLARTFDLLLSNGITATTDLAEICSQMDISLSAWCSLLPPSKRQCLTSTGDIDKHLFKASMLINAYIVDLHRPLSDLAYNPIESVSRCGPPPPSQKVLQADSETRRLHTAKALLGIRRMGDLLPLPVNIVAHTPFLICTIANTMVAHLSACRYVFRGRALQLERERVRAAMGALRVLGEHWPFGRRTYREMGVIAREVLSLAEKDIPRLQHQPPTAPVAPLPVAPDPFSDNPLDVPSSAFFDFHTLPPDFLGSWDTFAMLTDVRP